MLSGVRLASTSKDTTYSVDHSRFISDKHRKNVFGFPCFQMLWLIYIYIIALLHALLLVSTCMQLEAHAAHLDAKHIDFVCCKVYGKPQRVSLPAQQWKTLLCLCWPLRKSAERHVSDAATCCCCTFYCRYTTTVLWPTCTADSRSVFIRVVPERLHAGESSGLQSRTF